MGLNKEFATQIEYDVTRVWTSTQPVPPTELFLKHLETSGGSDDMNVDGTTPVNFDYQVPAGKRLIITRVIFDLHDADIEYDKFAGLGAALTNGLAFQFSLDDGSTFNDFTPHTITTTAELGHLAGTDVQIVSTGVGVDPDVVLVRWTLDKFGFVPVWEPGNVVRIKVQDNLAAVEHFRAILQGRLWDK